MSTRKYMPLNEPKKKKKEFSGIANKDGDKTLHDINWERDLLPEYLWIDYLFQKGPNEKYQTHVYFDNLIDRIDPLLDKNSIFIGLVSDFGKIPLEKREQFKNENSHLIQKAVLEPMGNFLKLYKNSPMSWLLDDSEELKPEEINETLKLLSDSVIRLIEAKDKYCGMLRVVSFRRLLKHRDIIFNINYPITTKVVESIKVYPEGCSDEERYLIESQTQAVLNMHIEDKRNGYQSKEWPKYFWRRNYEISGCVPAPIHINLRYNPKNVDIYKLNEIIEHNIDVASKHLRHLLNNIKLDLYSPQKDEITLGLIFRIIKLIVILWENELSWTLDIGQIIIRCSAESCIVLNYLLKKDSEELYKTFIQYGEARDKLLLSKLHECGDELKGIQDESLKDLNREQGDSFLTEMKDINLGSWPDKNIRDMAVEIGMKDFYDLIYDRASEYVHGTWNSIKYAHLMHCLNPLHGFHKIPDVHNPVQCYNILLIGLKILKITIDCFSNHYDIPKMEKEFLEFHDAFDLAAD